MTATGLTWATCPQRKLICVAVKMEMIFLLYTQSFSFDYSFCLLPSLQILIKISSIRYPFSFSLILLLPCISRVHFAIAWLTYVVLGSIYNNLNRKMCDILGYLGGRCWKIPYVNQILFFEGCTIKSHNIWCSALSIWQRGSEGHRGTRNGSNSGLSVLHWLAVIGGQHREYSSSQNYRASCHYCCLACRFLNRLLCLPESVLCTLCCV